MRKHPVALMPYWALFPCWATPMYYRPTFIFTVPPLQLSEAGSPFRSTVLYFFLRSSSSSRILSYYRYDN